MARTGDPDGNASLLPSVGASGSLLLSSGWKRIVLAAGVFLAYALALLALYRVFDAAAGAFVIIPVIVVAWLLGSLGGLFAGMLAPVVNSVAISGLGQGNWGAVVPEGLTFGEAEALIVGVGAIIGILRDLEGRVEAQAARSRRAEEARQESEDRYRTLFEDSKDAVCILDRDGRFVEANPATRDVFGYEEPELQGVKIQRLFAQPETWREFEREILQRGSITDEYADLETRSGAPRFCTISGTMRKDGRKDSVEYELIIRDVTERRQLEEQVRQSQRIEAMGRMTGGIAHDFNNILTVIQTNAEILADEEAIRRDAVLEETVGDLLGTARRGRRLIRKLLEFSQPGEMTLRVVDLTEVVRSTEKTLRSLVPSDIGLELDLPEEEQHVLADPTGIDQILLNLVTNARDAISDDGVIHVSVHETRLEEEDRVIHGRWVEPGDYVCLSVTDTGTGMDEEAVERIFEPFYTSKPAAEGTGLGMAVVYGLVKQHEGFVNVYTEPGIGTTIKVYLPVAEGKADSIGRDRTPARRIRGGSETVLFVDDNEALRRAARRSLERFGYTVHLAGDGGRGLQLFDTQDDVDLVVTDLVMPDVGGVELRERIRERDSRVEIILTTGYGRPGQEVTSLLDEDPHCRFLQKPWTVADLARKIRESLDGSG